MNKLLNQSRRFVNRNASTILTCVGGVGVIATSVLAVKATPKALILLEQAREEKEEDLSKLDILRVAGPAYIPAFITGAATLARIFGANALNKRQQASLMSAYALLDNSYKEYKNKTQELYGEEAETRIIEEIAKDKYEETEVSTDNDEQLFYDYFSGRYFESTIEKVQNAEYRINRTLTMRDYVYLNEFYELLDIDPIESGYTLGWSTGSCLACYWQNWIDFDHEKVEMDDGLECIIVKMQIEPVPDFQEYA